MPYSISHLSTTTIERRWLSHQMSGNLRFREVSLRDTGDPRSPRELLAEAGRPPALSPAAVLRIERESER